jgi:hypothetical protein
VNETRNLPGRFNGGVFGGNRTRGRVVPQGSLRNRSVDRQQRRTHICINLESGQPLRLKLIRLLNSLG